MGTTISDGRSRVRAWRRRSPKSSTPSQRHAGMPNASASLTKSGLVKSTPKWRPNFLSCFQTIEPYWRVSPNTLTIGVGRRPGGSRPPPFIREPPPPVPPPTGGGGGAGLGGGAPRRGGPPPRGPVGGG